MAKKRIIENGLTECANCGKILSEDLFYKSKGGGLHPYCKECKKYMYKERRSEKRVSLNVNSSNDISGFSSKSVERHLNTIARYLNRLGYYESLLSDDGVCLT